MYDKKIMIPQVQTGDTTTTVPGWMMILVGAALIGMLEITKKKEKNE